MSVKHLPEVDQIPIEDLNDILYDFYSSVKPQKKDDYSVQSLKCLCAGLNRHFRKQRGIDITTDSMFVKANEMFEAVKVNAKKQGLGVKRSYPLISQVYLERIAEYFLHDHITKPEPKRLEQNMLFYIIYFFCRRGRENLYTMKRNTFKLIVEADGTEYYMQDLDEIDKNHTADDTSRTNEGRMYATNSEFIHNCSIINLELQQDKALLSNINGKLKTHHNRQHIVEPHIHFVWHKCQLLTKISEKSSC